MIQMTRYDEDEVILLLDACLQIKNHGQNKRKIIEDLSETMRKRALIRGLAITDSFRSVDSLTGRSSVMECVYDGLQVEAPTRFRKIVELYKNNYPEYKRRLDEIRESLTTGKIPTGREDATVLLAKVLKSHQDSFRRWLRKRGDELGFKANYWNHLVKILDISAHYGFIDSSLNEEVLTRIETELFALPDFQQDVFVSRDAALLALRNFIDYWNDDSKEDEEDEESEEYEEDAADEADEGPEGIFGELLYQFDTGTRLERTRPTRIKYGKRKTLHFKSWTELYVWVVRSLYRQYPKELQGVLQKEKIAGNHSDFLDKSLYNHFKDVYRHNLKRIDDNFYLNTNHSATVIVEKIHEWFDVCGLDISDLSIYYAKRKNQNLKGNRFSKGASDAKKKQSASRKLQYKKTVHVKAALDAIRELFPNGFKLDDSTIALLEKKIGGHIKISVFDYLQEKSFHRRDGLSFLSDSIIDPALEEEIVRKVQEYLKKNGSFEVQVLYNAYADVLNPACIRDVGDFADWVRFFTTRRLKVSFIGTFAIARAQRQFRTEEEFSEFLLQKIRAAVDKYDGSLEEEKIREMFAGFSLEALCYLIRSQADDLFVKEIDGKIYFKNFEGAGVSEDFSQKLLKTLGQIDDLKLIPTSDTIHALLSLNLKCNVREAFGLEEDKYFRKLVEANYKGKKPRKWRKGVFGKKEK